MVIRRKYMVSNKIGRKRMKQIEKDYFDKNNREMYLVHRILKILIFHLTTNQGYNPSVPNVLIFSLLNLKFLKEIYRSTIF